MAVNTLSKTSSSNYDPATSSYSDEISLFDLWNILVRRRWWVLGVWLLTLLAAVAYLSLAQPVFESRAVVQVGRVGGTLITPAPALVLELKERYQVGEPNRERPYLKSVKQEGDDALVLEAEAETATEARQFLDRVLQTLLVAQERRYDESRRLNEAALAPIESQIKSLEEDTWRLGEVGNSSIDEAAKALILLQSSGLQADLSTLHQQRFQLRQRLSSLNSFSTQAIREPTLAERASKPRPALILALALVLGGMLGSVIVFFVSFMEEARNRKTLIG